ncbi:MAG: YkgJ family cysteine cluster protein [Xanthomonadales bacterium]|jgi:Fe-S-cluster containining protein|nr:YkgJ family cysteine cluster protein [Xanthomonadales bacterium]
MRPSRPATRKSRDETLTANAEISVDGRKIQLNLVVPAGKVPPESILPILHHFSEQVTEGVEDKSHETGKTIACRKGCGACCRQPVPVTPAEARQLAALVEGMPEQEKATIQKRFESAMQRAEDAGISGILLGLGGMDEKTKREGAQAYFSQGIACPFLVNESCSIHPVRPLVCREYLVTSSPEHCENLDGPNIHRLPFPAPITQTFGKVDSRSNGEDDRFILLISVLEWASEHPAGGKKRPGPEWVQEFFQELSRSDIPDPSPYL